jgi:hypothetical protein
MATPIKLQVVTEQNGDLVPVTDAQVVVGRRDLVGESDYPYADLLPTFQHSASGNYVNATGDPDNEPSAGEWLLVVRKPGFSLVVQKLTLSEKNGILRAKAGWKEPGTPAALAACVSIVNFDQTPTQTAGATQTLVTVRLFAAQRYVGLGCRDHRGGTRFSLFAEGRRDFLYDSGVLNEGCIATIIDCKENVVATSVKTAKSSPRDWLVVHSGPPLTEKATILDFYEFLHQVGQNDAGTVVEAGVFGHAWHQGPIVQGSFDHSADMDVRDADDADGRPKDWYPNGEVATNRSQLKQSFAAKARMVIWGCSHMVDISAEAAECNRRVAAGTARNQFFLVGISNGGVLNTTLDHAKASIAQNVLSARKGRFPEEGAASGKCTYDGMLAQALNGVAECFAATPGAGANFGSVNGPARPRGSISHISMLMLDQGENLQLKRFYEREYGSSYERDALRYMNYTKFLGVQLPNPGYSTQRFARFFYDELVADVLRLPSRLEIFRKRNTGGFDSPVAFSRDGEQGHLYVAQKATLDGVQIRGAETMIKLLSDASQDLGFFVTQSGKTLWFERPKGGDFQLPKQPARLFQTTVIFDPHFKPTDGDPGTPLAGNLLEQVVPRFFW